MSIHQSEIDKAMSVSTEDKERNKAGFLSSRQTWKYRGIYLVRYGVVLLACCVIAFLLSQESFSLFIVLAFCLACCGALWMLIELVLVFMRLSNDSGIYTVRGPLKKIDEISEFKRWSKQVPRVGIKGVLEIGGVQPRLSYRPNYRFDLGGHTFIVTHPVWDLLQDGKKYQAYFFLAKDEYVQPDLLSLERVEDGN